MPLLRRLLRRLTGRDTHERLAALEKRVSSIREANRDSARDLGSRVSELAKAVQQQPTAKDIREVRQAVRHVAATVDRALPRVGASALGRASEAEERRVRKQLDRIASSGRPIFVGPWSGEVGFELLYWIPFVEWVRSQWNLTSRR